MKRKPDFFKINLDASRAFDSLLRHKVIEILEKKKVNPVLINAIAKTLTGTFMEINGKKIETHIGVP